MSFLKIKDPLKREQTVKEFIDLKKRIRDRNLVERTGRLKYEQRLSMFFKPVTEAQKQTAMDITGELGPIKKGIKKLESIINLKGFPSILAYDFERLDTNEIGDIITESDEKGINTPLILGEIAKNQLKRYDDKDKVDTTFGFYEKDGKLYIGDKEVNIFGNAFVLVGEQDYETDTSGLWELIIAKDPDRTKYDDTDLSFYRDIMIQSNALYRNNNPLETRHKSAKGMPKWKNILSKIWDMIKTGSGITVIPSDPNALLERLDLLMASKGAGNTGVRNELVSICDELKRQRILDTKAYKKLMSKLKK